MAKNAAKRRRRRDRFDDTAEIIPFGEFRDPRERRLPIRPLNRSQAGYLQALKSGTTVVALGPAGTGKTWIAASVAADRLRDGAIDRIILTRPTVPCGRSLGFFPGSLESKFAPWAVPLVDAIADRMGKGAYDIAVRNRSIEVVPFEVMRGRSWRNAFVILDEAQNATLAELKTFLTRLGEGCTAVVNGDISQRDLESAQGLETIVSLIQSRDLPVPIVEFAPSDVVRSDTCAMWVEAFAEARI